MARSKANVNFLLRWWWILLLGPIAAAIPAAYLANKADAVYQSKATVLVVSDTGLEASDRLTNTYAALVKLRPVISSVKTKLGLNLTEDELAKKIVVSADFSSQLIKIEAKDSDPGTAALIANTTAATFVSQTNATLVKPVEPVSVAPGQPPPPSPAPALQTVRVVEDAIPSETAVRPSIVINIVLAAALGFLVAGSIALALDAIWLRPQEA